MQSRDIVVVGSSMGGIEALSSMARQLPEDLPAAVLVVQHTSPESPGVLADILNMKGAMTAVMAKDGMALENGRIYVAPPNRHLLVTSTGVRVSFGPRENRSRPAIDPLFRTAAVNYRNRVIGVVLTGLLGDGAAGLLAVQRCGGMALVQAPDDAAFPDMPLRALELVKDARQFAIDDLGKLLIQHCGERAPAPPKVPEGLAVETKLTERSMAMEDWGVVPSKPTNFTCPECKGAIHEIRDEGLARFRCRVGHAYSSHDLLGDKVKAVEEALWMALQSLEERTQMLEMLSSEERERGRVRGAGTYSERARETRDHADRLRDLIMQLPT